MHLQVARHQPDLQHASVRAARGFTITELLIAVVVLIVVILGSTQIFSSAGRVASVGSATADILQEAAAIERQLRRDLSNLAPEGFFAIRNVSVRNDIDGPGTLLNPNLPANALIRSDQLVFFVNSVESTSNFRASQRLNRKAQSTTARMYYGHGFQIPESPGQWSFYNAPLGAKDPVSGAGILPWSSGSVNFNSVVMTGSAGSFFNTTGGTFQMDVSQPEARQWVLMRHPLLLADDGGAVSIHLNQLLTGRRINSPEVVNGRVDAVAQRLTRGARQDSSILSIREEVTNAGNPQDQRDYIADNYLFYPRGERSAPSMHRVDQSLTNNVLGTACSSIRIEWMYDPGVGATPTTGGVHEALGSGVTPVKERDNVWFGLPDAQTGIDTYRNYPGQAQAIYWENIERQQSFSGGDVQVYDAIFGFNPDKPYLNPITELPSRVGQSTHIDEDAGYTPWPTAIRVTMTLHDPAATIEAGREVQFVIRLPQRVN